MLVAGWSIYTQSVKIKQWCALCLGIVAILLLQSALSGYIFYATGLDSMVSWDALMMYAGIAVLVSLIFLPVKKLLKANQLNQLKLVELKKWKLDAGLFLTQWQQEQEVDTTEWENDLIIGNPQAPLKITVACNPLLRTLRKSTSAIGRTSGKT